MTKLEEKLVELGYYCIHTQHNWNCYQRLYNNCRVVINIVENRLSQHFVDTRIGTSVETQQDIDNLQQAFNVMQKDLEILKECENDEN